MQHLHIVGHKEEVDSRVLLQVLYCDVELHSVVVCCTSQGGRHAVHIAVQRGWDSWVEFCILKFSIGLDESFYEFQVSLDRLSESCAE